MIPLSLYGGKLTVDYLSAREAPKQCPGAVTHPKGCFSEAMAFLIEVIKYVHSLQYLLGTGLKCCLKIISPQVSIIKEHLVTNHLRAQFEFSWVVYQSKRSRYHISGELRQPCIQQGQHLQ